MATIKELKRYYIEALREGYAGIFAGAGLSRPSGYVDWKELLRTVAYDISLDVEKEDDLVAVAQFYKNEKRGHGNLNKLIMDNFTKNTKANRNLELLSTLPIKTYWTTNYDSLLEKHLEQIGKKVDVKREIETLAYTMNGRDAVVYKMHGCVSNPSKAILTKDDYEAYQLTHSLFTTALQGDLISKTFLFIGFSFEDPNISYILSQIRLQLSNNQRQHYCFLKKVNKDDYSNIEDYYYDKTRQELKINDLLRYSINAVMIEEYSEITTFLEEISSEYLLNQVFISGSAVVYDEFKGHGRQLISKLAKQLIVEKFKVITGNGLGVGSFVISGALSANNEYNDVKLEDDLKLRAFPFQEEKTEEMNILRNKYRENMIEESGIIIFIFGNAFADGKLVNSRGVRKEFEIAKQKNKYIIPLGTTGYTSKEIFNEIKMNISMYSYLDEHIEVLEKETNIDTLIKSIVKILKQIDDF
jgi:hypothetical protein